jgi:hypothetical protein
MKLTRENPITRGNTCPSATLSTTNPTLTDPGSKTGLRGERTATNRLRHGTVMGKKYILQVGIKDEIVLKSTEKDKNCSEIESTERRNIYYNCCHVSVAVEALFDCDKILIHWSWRMTGEHCWNNDKVIRHFMAILRN